MLFAGTTVVIAIAGLRIAGIPAIATMGFASAITVAVAMLAAVTLLPAFLGLAGTAIDSWHIGRKRAEVVDAHHTVAGRWADHVGTPPVALRHRQLRRPCRARRPGRWRCAPAWPTTAPPTPSTTYRQAYDLLAEGFGDGLQRPADRRRRRRRRESPRPAEVPRRHRRHRRRRRSSPSRSSTRPATPPSSRPSRPPRRRTRPPRRWSTPCATTCCRRRWPAPARTSFVTGQTAAFIDISERLAARLPLFIGAVVGLSFLLLMMVFRSVLVPLKAAVMNLLSIGAAYGVVVAVFQWGWGSSAHRCRSDPCRSARSCR